MKIRRIAITASITLAIAATAVLAQGQKDHFRGGNFGSHFVERVAAKLALTEAQKQTATTLFDQASTAAKPLREDLKQNHKELAEAVKTGKPEAELTAIASRGGAIMGQLSAVRASAMSKFYAQLTPEQKQKADGLEQSMMNRSQHRRFRGGSQGENRG